MQKDGKGKAGQKKEGQFERGNVNEGKEWEKNFCWEVTRCQQVLKIRQNNALQLSKDLSWRRGSETYCQEVRESRVSVTKWNYGKKDWSFWCLELLPGNWLQWTYRTGCAQAKAGWPPSWGFVEWLSALGGKRVILKFPYSPQTQASLDTILPHCAVGPPLVAALAALVSCPRLTTESVVPRLSLLTYRHQHGHCPT